MFDFGWKDFSWQFHFWFFPKPLEGLLGGRFFTGGLKDNQLVARLRAGSALQNLQSALKDLEVRQVFKTPKSTNQPGVSLRIY